MRRSILYIAVLALLLAGTGPAEAFLLYAADGAAGNANTHLYILNPADGSVVTDLGPIVDASGNHYAVTGLAFHPTTGVLYGSTGNQSPTAPGHLISINSLTAIATDIGDFDAVANNFRTMADLTFDPTTGTLHGWFEPTPGPQDDLFKINLATGLGTKVGEAGISTFGSGLAANSAGTVFVAGDGACDGCLLRTVNTTTGAVITVATLSGAPIQDGAISALTFGSGTLYGANLSDFNGGPAHLVTINTATGAVTDLGASVDNLDAIAVLVPEPSTIVLLGAGLAGLCLARRRKK